MVKRSELFFTFLLVPVDAVAIFIAAFTAYFLRHETDIAGHAAVIFTIGQFLTALAVVIVVWLILFALLGLYQWTRSKRLSVEVSRVAIAVSAGMMLVIVYVFFAQEFILSSRFIILSTWLFAIIAVSLGRMLVHGAQRWWYRSGHDRHHLVLIGKNATSGRLASFFERDRQVEIEEVLEISDTFSVDAAIERLRALVSAQTLDEVLVTQSDLAATDLARLVDVADELHITYKYTPNLFQAQAVRADVATLDGIPVIELTRTPLEGWGRIVKRLVDIVVALVAIIILSPVMLLTWIAVRLDSKGRAIYVNQRVNHEGKTFGLYKFRSYFIEYCVGDAYGGTTADKVENELIAKQSARTGPLYKIENDPRITRIGRFIRKTSLDEFPQFFNVLKGDMSLVGPRPHVPKEVAKYQRRHKKVLTIKPGITGLPQINGRSDLDFEQEVQLDVYYIENWSLLLDLIILVKTPFALFRKRNTV